MCVRGSSGEDCAGHLLCKPENSLIQFIGCKSGCAACMRMATGQKVTDVWRHRLDVWYFVMHFKKRSLLSENVLKMLFSMCVWGHRYWVELYFFALMHNVFIHNSTNGSPPHIGHHLRNVWKKTVHTVIFISVQSSAYISVDVSGGYDQIACQVSPRAGKFWISVHMRGSAVNPAEHRIVIRPYSDWYLSTYSNIFITEKYVVYG